MIIYILLYHLNNIYILKININNNSNIYLKKNIYK